MKLTPSQVLDQCAVSKSTLYRDMQHKASWEMDGKGRRVLDVAEADRLYDKKPFETPEERPMEHPGNVPDRLETALFEQKIAFLEEQLTDKERQLEEKRADIATLNSRLDRAEQEKLRLTLLLTDQRPRHTWWRFWERVPATTSG